MYMLLFLQPVHHTFDSLLHQDNIPIEKEPQTQISQPHIRQQLGFVQRQHLFDSLVFNRHHIFDKCINPIHNSVLFPSRSLRLRGLFFSVLAAGAAE